MQRARPSRGQTGCHRSQCWCVRVCAHVGWRGVTTLFSDVHRLSTCVQCPATPSSRLTTVKRVCDELMMTRCTGSFPQCGCKLFRNMELTRREGPAIGSASQGIANHAPERGGPAGEPDDAHDATARRAPATAASECTLPVP